MILTTCAVCAVPLPDEASATCAKCDTRYCSAACRHSHWRGGHRGLCPEIRRAGGAEQYNADKRYAEAVEVAVEECAEDTKGQTCYICLEDGSEEGLVRGCACRGAAGVAHVSCLAKQAKILCDEVDDSDDERYDESWNKWNKCGMCKQHYHGMAINALGWACWKSYVGLPEADDKRCAALRALSHCIAVDDRDGASAICIHQANIDSVRRFMPDEEGLLLHATTNLALAYKSVGRDSEALALQREVYAQSKELGDEDDVFFSTVTDLALSLMEADLWGEAKTLLREHLTAASDSLGADHLETLYAHLYYAESLLYDDGGAETTYEQDRADYLESERIAADVLRRAERIYGSGHPVTVEAQDILKEAREDIAANERKTSLRALPKRPRYN